MANLKYIGKNVLNHDLIIKKGNVSGSVTSTGSFGSLVVADKVQGALTVGGNLNVSQYIYHADDANTYLNFTNDRLRFNIGGISYIDLNDNTGPPRDITFNDGGNNVDLTIKGSSNNPLFKTDASANRIGTHGKGTPEVAFHIGGSELRVDGNISGSSTGTGSFGTIQTTTGTIPTLLGDTTFNDNLTVTGNLDIADTIYHTGYSNTKIRFPEADTIAFNTSGLERLRITSDGQISGSAVSTGSFGQLIIGNGGDIELIQDQRIYFEADKGTYIETDSTDRLRMVVGGNQMLLLDEDEDRVNIGYGNKLGVGLGNHTTPGEMLEVVGNISGSGTGSFSSLVVADKVQGDLTIGDSLTSNKGATFNAAQSSAHDFRALSVNKNYMLYVDANKDKVGIGFQNPEGKHLSSSLHIAGDLTTDSHITASGNFSGSLISTGSFGTLETSGVVNATGRIFENGTSVIDHATAMAIVFGG